MACSGVLDLQPHHTKNLVDCALAFQDVTKYFRSPTSEPIIVRIGIHTGFVIAGVVGRKMPRYHLFGETVTIAEELEARCPPGSIVISGDTLRALTEATTVSDVNSPLAPTTT